MKINIHPLFYLFMVIAVLTGYFKDLLMIMSIITIHELGHVLTALYYKWAVEEIKVLPFGGMTIFKGCINRPIKEELFILIMGPLFQIIGCLIINCYINNDLFMHYNYLILLFNLLPIIPLDGSKLVNITFDYLFPFFKSYTINIYISTLSIIIIFIFLLNINFNFICYMILLFLLLEIIRYYKKRELVFNRFLLERYQRVYIFKKLHIIKSCNLKKMKRDFRHLFYDKNKCYTEREIISKRFDFKR